MFLGDGPRTGVTAEEGRNVTSSWRRDPGQVTSGLWSRVDETEKSEIPLSTQTVDSFGVLVVEFSDLL